VLVKGTDLLLVATGYMVHEARQATLRLKERGISATLIDLYSLPLDTEAIVALARENQGRVLSVEDHYGATFGSAVADALGAGEGDFHVEQMYVRRIPKSARTPGQLLKYLGLSADDIIDAALGILGITTPSQMIIGEPAPGS
jgi:transketolase